jgi:hypothetical protein
MAEELRLEEGLRYPRAVDGDEWFSGASGMGVDGVREEPLPGPTLTGQEYGRIDGGGALAEEADLTYGLALPEYLLEGAHRQSPLPWSGRGS